MEFQVTSVIERAQMHSAADKDRLVAQLAPVLGSVGPSVERDEQMRRVAGRLDLREHLLANLLQDTRQVLTPAAPHAQRRRRRSSAPSGRSWRCACRAVSVAASTLPACPTSISRRTCCGRLATGCVEHFDAPTAGLATDEPELARVVSEIVVRASSEPASEHALELAFLQLERRRLEREIKAAVEAEDFDRQRELSVERSQVITRLMGSGEPSPSTTDGRG